MKSTNYFRIAAAIGGIIIAFFVGRFTTQQENSGIMNDGKQSYLLLLREDSTFNGMDIPALVSEYSQWARDMASRNQLVGAEKLTDESYVLGTLAPVDGPGVPGYFIIRAANLNDAQSIAQSHPHLKYNGGIELRPIDALEN